MVLTLVVVTTDPDTVSVTETVSYDVSTKVEDAHALDSVVVTVIGDPPTVSVSVI